MVSLMNVLILGFGQMGCGFDAAFHFASHGHSVRVSGSKKEPCASETMELLESMGVDFCKPETLDDDIAWADIIVKSNTIGIQDIGFPSHKEVVNDLSMLFSTPQIKNVKIICVSGAKSKTTTASALCHALNYMGISTHMCGNMGISGFCERERLENGDIPQYLICELSYGQIRDTIDIMDWDLPFVDISIFTGLGSKTDVLESFTPTLTSDSRIVICPDECRRELLETLNRRSKDIFAVEGLCGQMSKALPKYMEWAFATLRKLGITAPQANKALKTFKGIPNRGELVARTESLMFINDSSSSIPEAVGFTVGNLSNLPVHLICGGYGKDLDATGMESVLKSVSSIHLLSGTFTDQRLIPFLNGCDISYNGPFPTMEEAVRSACEKAAQSQKLMQVVLLSPGVPAQYRYRNEFFRGDAFRKAVEEANKKLD